MGVSGKGMHAIRNVSAAALLAMLAALLLFAGPAGAANPAADLDQCGNGTLASPNSCPPGWENGNLNASKSHYREGDSVPFRLLLTNLDLGSHTVVIQYDTLQSSKHAYDYLTSFDRTVGDADPCGSGGAAGGSAVSPCVSGGSFPIPSAGITFTNPASSQVSGSVSIWNGTITNVAYGGASDAAGQQSVTITFTVTNATSVLAWGGHIGSQIDWGLGTSAGAIPGSPYHMRLISLDGSGGNQDRSLAAGAILPIPASFETQVNASSIVLGQSVTDTATLSGDNGPVSGSMAFFVCGPNVSSNPDCSTGGTKVGATKTFSGGTVTSDSFAPSQAGHYCFRAEYTPDLFAPYSASVHTNTTTECFEVTLPLGQLEVVKHLVSGAGKFNLFIKSGDTTLFSATDVGDGGTTGKHSVAAGSYQVGETAGTGTSLGDYTSSISCTGGASTSGPGPLTVAVANGDDITCTVTNTLKPSSLTVTKVLVPSNDTGTFNLLIDSVTKASAVGNGGTTGAVDLPAGVHTVSETGANGTSLGDYTSVIGGDCAANGTVTLNPGDAKTCTITNTLKPAHLTVTKVLVPSDDPGKFNLLIDSGVKAANVGNGGTTGSVELAPGSHTVSETAGTATTLGDYTSVIGGDCATDGTVTLAPGQSKSCTITNTLKPAHLTVTKVLAPSDDPGKFNLLVDGGVKATDVGNGGTTGSVELAPGSHTVSETGGTATSLAKYASVIGGDCASDGTVSLAPGESKTCTITNTRRTGTLEVVKHFVGTAGKVNLLIEQGDSTIASASDVGDGGTLGPETVDVGTYTVVETEGTGTKLSDYSSSIACVGGESTAQGSGTELSVPVGDGEEVVCTITNTLKGGTIEVRKSLNPTSDAGRFNLLVDDVTKATNVGHNGTTGLVEVAAGSHKVSETGSGTSLGDYTSSIVCRVADTTLATGSGTSLTVQVAPGTNVICTVSNTRNSTPPPPPPPPPPASTIEVVKALLPSTDAGRFDLQVDGVTKKSGAGDGGTTGQITVAAGTHTVGELASAGTSLGEYTASVQCKQDTTVLASGSGSGPLGVAVTPGAHVVCTITNVRKTVDLAITKRANPTRVHVGDQITYTIVVTNSGPGTATGVTMTDPMPAQVQFVSVSTSQGSCTGGAVIQCSLGTIAAGGSVTITVVGKATAVGTAVNTAVTVAQEPEANTGNNRASATVTIVGEVFLPPACYSAAAKPTQLTVGKRTTIVVTLRAGVKPVAGVRVFVRGPGIFKWAKTDKRGVARITVTPKRPGIVRVQVLSHATCTQPRIGVVGVFTPPVTG